MRQAMGQRADEALLAGVERVVRGAGSALLQRFSTDSRPSNPPEIIAALDVNDGVSSAVLEEGLAVLRPGVRWALDEQEPDQGLTGEWWVVDPVEGNVNHVHGMPDWGVTVTLVRDGTPSLAVVHLPALQRTCTARHGGGARENGHLIRSSAKTDMTAALVGTGQAAPGEGEQTHRLLGASVRAMLEVALLVRVSVPSTLQLIDVAAGRTDVFWQFASVRSGVMAGALLVTEAGGVVSDTRGHSWDHTRPHLLACAPGLHDEAVETLSPLS